MSFKDIKGHEKEIEQIKKMLKNGRIPHALLFSGPEGIGKKTLALELVKYLNCENPDCEQVLSCEQCPSCLRINGGRQPELFLIEDSEGSIKLEEVKNMASLLSLKSNLSNYKAIIIDNSQLLRVEAANSLLKIMEEPGEKTIFILISSNENMLLPTIKSRLQKISFTALSEQDLRELAENHKLYSDKLDFLLAYAQGSFGKLKTWLKDSDFLEELKSFQELFPPEDDTHLFQIMQRAKIFERDKAKLLRFLDFFVLSLEKDKSLYQPGARKRLIEEIIRAQEMLLRNINPRLVGEMLLIKSKLLLKG